MLVDSVVLPGATLGERARLERSLVMGRVGAGCDLVDCVVGADAEVPSGSRLVATRVPDPTEATAGKS